MDTDYRPKDKYMYRTEDFSGEGYRDPARVLAFEASELGNTDGIKSMIKNWLEKDTKLYKTAEKYYEMIKKEGLESDSAESFFDDCIKYISNKTGININFAIWLGTKDMVINDYPCAFPVKSGINPIIDEYDTTNGIILDDLGSDGMLVGFNGEQVPTKSEYMFKDELEL